VQRRCCVLWQSQAGGAATLLCAVAKSSCWCSDAAVCLWYKSSCWCSDAAVCCGKAKLVVQRRCCVPWQSQAGGAATLLCACGISQAAGAATLLRAVAKPSWWCSDAAVCCGKVKLLVQRRCCVLVV